ncbi:MAG: TonB-dependent receptor [Paludibacter sp.]|nr:TonB-dependent receptor [Paludibacter sp.]
MKQFLLLSFALLYYAVIFAETPSDADSKQNAEDIELMELVVSASRTQTKLKEVPSSVSVMTASSLETNEINTLSNATSFIPNFFMPEYGSKLTSPVYIRGIGSRINAPSVGMYVDNVPYFEKAAFNFDFFDVQKIEVLRGPQGTLYGRNSMGGLINITTRSPLDYQGTHVQLSAGNYGMYKINAGHYQKISDKLGYSISANYLHQDGFYTNIFFNEKVDMLDAYGLRLKLQYLISDKWSLDFTSNVDQSNQGGYPYALYDKATQTDGFVNYNQKSGYDRYLMSNALRLKYVSQDWELSNTFSYQLLDDNQQIDQDFGPDSVNFAGQLQKQHNFANELVLQSNANKRYNWLVGFFAFLQDAGNTVDVDSYKTFTPEGNVYLWYQKRYFSVTEGAALFHQSSYKILPQLTVTGGIRFDYEQSRMQYQYEGKKAGAELAAIDTVYPSLHDMVLLPKLALSYELNDKTNFYASYSTGYKPGGFNSTFEKPEHLMFKKESSHNFEAGVKAELIGYLYTDLSVFYTNLKNQQIYRTAPSGSGSYLDNSGLSNNRGLEFTVQNHSFHGFEGMIAYGYTHAEILEYVSNETVNYNNHFTPYIPRHTLMLQGMQNIKLPMNKWVDRIKLNVAYNETGELYWNLTNNLKEERYGILNAKVILIRGNLQIDLWAKNLTNTQYHAFMFESRAKVYAQAGKPMQAGVNLSVKF